LLLLWQGAATLKYEVIPELEKRIATLVASQMTSDEAGPSLLPSLLGADQIAAVVSRWTHIPVQKLTLSDRERVLKLGERLQSRVIGQENAVRIVADAILRSRAGVSREGQPQGAFLFLGPTGVGKTELAKVMSSLLSLVASSLLLLLMLMISQALCEQLFDDEKKIGMCFLCKVVVAEL
jgi:ATP-dependent Clp protease ATP-binding subunit ClpB